MESPFLGMDEGRFSHGTPNFGDWWGNLRGEPLIFIVWGTFGCVWETGGGIFGKNCEDPAPTVGADAACPNRGAARHVATNASRPIKTPPRRLIHRGLPVRDGGFRPRGLGADAQWIKMRFLGLAGARATPNRISRALRGRNPTLRHRCGRGIGGATRPLCDWGSGDCKSGWRGLGGPLRSYRRVARRGGVGMAGGAALCTHTGAVGCTPAGVCTHTGAGGCACSDVARRVAIKGAPRFNPPSNGCARASCRGGVFATRRFPRPPHQTPSRRG